MLDFIGEFFTRYYLSEGYNIVNTVTYGLVLGFIVFKLIPRLRPLLGRIDLWFILMLLPYVFYGASVRELVDQDLGLYAGHTHYPENYMLVSPGIYFTMFLLTLACILLGLGVRRLFHVDYRLVTGSIGAVFFAYNLWLIAWHVRYPHNLEMVFSFFVMSAVFVWGLKALLNLRYLDFEGNFYIILVHMFDASTTFVGVDLLGHFEKHVIPTLFINLFHTAAVMYPLKLLVLLPALYVIDDEMRGDEFGRRFIKFVIIVLGAGPAIRNMVLLLLG